MGYFLEFGVPLLSALQSDPDCWFWGRILVHSIIYYSCNFKCFRVSVQMKLVFSVVCSLTREIGKISFVTHAYACATQNRPILMVTREIDSRRVVCMCGCARWKIPISRFGLGQFVFDCSGSEAQNISQLVQISEVPGITFMWYREIFQRFIF